MPDILQPERAKSRPLRVTPPQLRGVGAGMTGLFNLYDQRPSNALTGRPVSLLGMSGNPQVVLRDGPALQGNIFGGADVFTTATLEAGNTELVPGTDTTFVWIGSLFSLTYGGVMCRGDDASGNGSSLRLKVTTGGEAQFSYVDTTPAAVTATTSGAAIAAGEPIVLIGTKRGSTVSVYCKNKSASASGGNGGLRTSGRGVSLNFAGSSSSTANGGAANHLLAATFNRALAPSEVQALLDNPWQLFRGTTQTIAGPTSAPGDTTLAASLSGSSLLSASISTSISLASTLAAGAGAAGGLATSISLAAGIFASASANGTLATAVSLQGAAACQSSAGATLSTQIRLAGNLQSSANLSGSIAGAADGTAANLSGSASCSSAASGALATEISLASIVGTIATASGALTTSIRLSGLAVSASSLSGMLSSGDLPIVPSQILLVRAESRVHDVPAESRILAVRQEQRIWEV